jgi:hypothetical protein
MKNLLKLVTSAAFVVAFVFMPLTQSAHAQSLASPWYLGTITGLTNRFTANATVTANTGSSVQVFNGPGAIEFSFNSVSANCNSNILLHFVRSFDNSTWETRPVITLTVQGFGVTNVIGRTNWGPGVLGAPYLKLHSVVVGNNDALTNLIIRVPSAPP